MTLKQKINCSNLAKILDVSPRTIRNWANDPVNPLPSYRPKGIWLFDVEEVQQWLEKQNNHADVDAIVNEIIDDFQEK